MNNKFFTVRNALFGVTAILIVTIATLSIISIFKALDQKSSAENMFAVNELLDEIAQLKINAAQERTYVNTAYGYEGVPEDRYLQTIQSNRRVIGFTVKSIEEKYAALVEATGADGLSGEMKALKAAFKDYAEPADQILSDVTLEKSERATESGSSDDMFMLDEGDGGDLSLGGDDELSLDDSSDEPEGISSTQIKKTYDQLIDAALNLRLGVENTFRPDNPRLSIMVDVKRQLWVMTEYANRDVAMIGMRIAGREKLGSRDLENTSRFNATTQWAWTQVQALSTSAALESSILRNQLSSIEEKFFREFNDNVRNPLIDESDTMSDDNDGENTYSISSLQWIEAASDATGPLNQMTGAADKLALELNGEAVSAANSALVNQSLLLVFAIGLGVLAVFVVQTRVVSPVNALSDTMMILADGNLEVEIPHADRVDEVGSMARSVEVFKENAVERRTMEEQQRQREEEERVRKAEEEEQTRLAEEQRREERRLREEEAREESRKAMLDLADKFEASVMGVVDAVSHSAGGLELAAQGLTSVAETTAGQSDVVAEAATAASNNANMVASAAEELSASVREITGQTNQSSNSAREAVGRTEKASNDISHLVEAAQKIGDVVKLINDIAEQTNLLALNATIEAARAGDAGKGFAVVASEVKSLANQTANATQEISQQVEGMQNATNMAVGAMEEIRGIIVDIEQTAVSIATAVEEQDASTQEIARNVAEVSSGTENVTGNIQSVSQGAATTGQEASQVLTAAQDLTRQSGELRSEVENFLETVRNS